MIYKYQKLAVDLILKRNFMAVEYFPSYTTYQQFLTAFIDFQ